MSVALDILKTYRAPRAILRRRVSGGQREDRALAVLMGGCILLFIAQWPRLSREAYLDESISFDARFGAALLGWIFVMPLVFYIVALLTHWLLIALRRASTSYETRMALFWALLASSPLWLLTGLLAGFVGPEAITNLIGLLALGAFFVFWVAGTIEVAAGGKESRAS